MVKHLMYIYKVPNSARRLGFVHSSDSSIKFEDLSEKLLELTKNYDVSIHSLSTESYTIESIQNKDPFFSDIEFYTDLDKFIVQLESIANITVEPLDFAKFLLSKFKLDKLQLQKTLFFIYTECLLNGRKIFDASPKAYDYGPVYPDVYQYYKSRSSREKIHEDYDIHDYFIASKLMYSGPVKEIVEKVMDAVKKVEPGRLINICHVKEGSWDRVYKEGQNVAITDDVILSDGRLILDKLYE